MANIRCVALSLAVIAFVAVVPASAEDQWSWPEQPKNLKVLPKDFGGKKLQPVMIGFTRALGVRCSYCHVGEEGKPLSTYDFASDANPNKERAREMYRMLGDITNDLKKIQPSGEKRVNMWCHTCHQGRPRPMTLDEDLGEAYGKSGIAGALARYRELRERYYGRSGYDFGEGSLIAFAHELLAKGDHDSAIAICRLNVAEYPQSGNVWETLGEAYAAAGNKLLAEIDYRKALELDPDNKAATQKLQELEAKPSE